MCSPLCYRVGISFVLLAVSLSSPPNCQGIPRKAVSGQHVSDLSLHANVKWFFVSFVCEIFLTLFPSCAIKVWMLGNLARATYVGSSDFMWPYSFNKCDARNRISQEINACAKVNHFGLAPFTGRGAPEIDVLEAMQGEKGKLPNTFIQRPYQSTSLQVAPGVEIDRPVLGHRPHEVRVELNSY